MYVIFSLYLLTYSGWLHIILFKTEKKRENYYALIFAPKHFLCLYSPDLESISLEEV